jgi:4-methyl-5(b-hydroxyethyl)-thiazole monophosphate biosynthesis
MSRKDVLTLKVFIFLTDGFEEIEAISPIDILRRAGIDVASVSITQKRQVKGSHGIIIEADTLLEECDFSKGEMLIIPGGPGTGSFNQHKEFIGLLTDYFKNEKWIASICAAPTILGNLGLLKGKKAICYPGMESDLKDASVEYNAKVVVDGKLITSKGPGTAIEFSLKIVECLIGNEAVSTLKNNMVI